VLFKASKKWPETTEDRGHDLAHPASSVSFSCFQGLGCRFSPFPCPPSCFRTQPCRIYVAPTTPRFGPRACPA
jgi:hypothetical protein